MAVVEKVMAALAIDEIAAQAVIAMFEEEGFYSLDEALEWAQEILDAPAHGFEEEVCFDEHDLFSEDEEKCGTGYHTVWIKGTNFEGFAA